MREGDTHAGPATAINGLEPLDCIIAAGLEVGSDFRPSRGLDGCIDTTGGRNHCRSIRLQSQLASSSDNVYL